MKSDLMERQTTHHHLLLQVRGEGNSMHEEKKDEQMYEIILQENQRILGLKKRKELRNV